jgi:hypothetical protein
VESRPDMPWNLQPIMSPSERRNGNYAGDRYSGGN